MEGVPRLVGLVLVSSNGRGPLRSSMRASDEYCSETDVFHLLCVLHLVTVTFAAPLVDGVASYYAVTLSFQARQMKLPSKLSIS